MCKFLLKLMIFIGIVMTPIVVINHFIDPANLYHAGIVQYATDALAKGQIIEQPGNMDEGEFQKQLIQKMKKTPDTVIIGSSHVAYLPLEYEYENSYNAWLSGAYLGDYYALIGLLEDNFKLPQRIIFGVDPWAFKTGYSEGRHRSIAEYADITHSNIEAGSRIGVHIPDKYIKEAEAFTFPYFQASLDALMENGIEKYTAPVEERIIICYNENPGDAAKLLPNARLVMQKSSINSAESIRESAGAIIRSQNIYQLGTEMYTVDKQNLSDFEKLILYLQNKGIEIKIYLPSWYPDVYDYFVQEDAFAGVMETEQSLREIGDRYGISVHGSYNPYICNLTKEDFSDWLHLKADKMVENYKCNF